MLHAKLFAMHNLKIYLKFADERGMGEEGKKEGREGKREWRKNGSRSLLQLFLFFVFETGSLIDHNSFELIV